MIWIGCLVLWAVWLSLTVHTLRHIRRNEKELRDMQGKLVGLWFRDAFEGPARLELFGHVTHIGWVRQGPERIDVLTIEGEALQCDTRARYRLTPLTWKEFVAECLQWRDEGDRLVEREIAARAKTEERRMALRCAISDALEAFNEWANSPEVAASMANRGIQILDAAREKDEEHDAPPF